MKNIALKSVTAFMALSLILSCDAVKNANNTQKGAAIGAGGGAVIGGIIGNNVGKGNTALGAIIGAVVGGAAGGYSGPQHWTNWPEFSRNIQRPTFWSKDIPIVTVPQNTIWDFHSEGPSL